MVKHFTLNDLVRFLYNDVESEVAVNICDQIAEEDSFRKSYTTLRDTKNELPKLNLVPRQAVVSRVLLYSSLNKVAKCN